MRGPSISARRPCRRHARTRVHELTRAPENPAHTIGIWKDGSISVQRRLARCLTSKFAVLRLPNLIDELILAPVQA